MAKKVKAKKVKPNTRFPGLPNYIGPNMGWFAFMHHGVLAEYSRNIMERIAYVKNHKPTREVPVRLANMMYLGDALGKKITASWKNDHYSVPYQEARAPDEMGAQILAYVRRHNPEHTWHDDTLHFTNKPRSKALQG